MDLETIGVTKTKFKQFESKGICTVQDLLQYMPRNYKDFRKLTGILTEDQISVLHVVPLSAEYKITNSNDYVMAQCREEQSGKIIKVYWFRQQWVYAKIKQMLHQTVVAAGKVTENENFGCSMMHPEIFEIGDDYCRIYPVYKSIPHMSEEYLHKSIAAALDVGLPESENMPQDILDRAQVVPMPTALKYIHTPETQEEIEEGQKRILFNDLVYFAVRSEMNRTALSPGSQYNIQSRALVNNIIQDLPYTLTEDQNKVVEQMIEDAEQGKRINALLQADVGAGKTICAALMAAAFIGNGYQAAIMAPTQVLAKQHYSNLTELFSPYNIDTVYLDSKLPAAEKKQVLKKIKAGEAQLIIGTHSCSAKDVEYASLALTIVDEEHRFGVQQRAAIVEKGTKGIHSITMSATPIPRSLASVIYGDNIQLHTIRSMPKGRKPVITRICRNPETLYPFVLRQIKSGHQVYVVCPMIDANDKTPEIKSVEETALAYTAKLGIYGVKVDTLTGKDTPEKTAEIIRNFQNGKTDILVSTTVVEVGVDVKNATLMVISNAERFGLSSLHQLRGRVGRNELQSYCILQSNDTSEKATARLNIMCETTDGFAIAEADLKQRGAGDLLGTQQAGSNKYAELILSYPRKYKYAVKVAKELIKRGKDSCPFMYMISEEIRNN